MAATGQGSGMGGAAAVAGSGPYPSSSGTLAAPQQPQQQAAAPAAKFKTVTLPTADQILYQDVMDNCFVKSGVSGVMGGLFGAAFGLFSASLDNAGAVSTPAHAAAMRAVRRHTCSKYLQLPGERRRAHAAYTCCSQGSIYMQRP